MIKLQINVRPFTSSLVPYGLNPKLVTSHHKQNVPSKKRNPFNPKVSKTSFVSLNLGVNTNFRINSTFSTEPTENPTRLATKIERPKNTIVE